MVDLTIAVRVTYAQPDGQMAVDVNLPEGSTVSEAIDASRIAAMIPFNSIDARRIGIFSRRVSLDHVVEEGDRIELYRPLAINPMEARRRRAR